MTVIKTPSHEWGIIDCPDNLCRCHWQCGVSSRSVIEICATDNRDDMQLIRFRGRQSIYTRSLDTWSHKDLGMIDADWLVEAMVILENEVKKPVRANKKVKP